ncbi:MAG: hypothetical protein KKB62_01345 [Nanoarchaeota archaeon]|nr:hypothetical protein [Nanoarchaeota archaeon]
MEKKIYSGEDSGFYCYSSFEKFMGQKKAILKKWTFSKNKIIQNWMYEDVKVSYENKGFGKDSNVSITLESEDEKKLEGIERIILNAAGLNYYLNFRVV